MLELVKNSRQTFQAYLDAQKDVERKDAERKRKNDEGAREDLSSSELSELDREIKNEQHRLHAAKSIISSGRDKLTAAMACETFAKSKSELVEAKSLIDIGTEKSDVSEAKIKKLEEKKSAIINENKKFKKK